MKRLFVHRACATIAAALVLIASTTWAARAQARPKAEVAVLLDADGVLPGRVLRVAVAVTLPDGVHVQSNAPRDPLLIPTTLTITTPRGFSIEEIVYPPSTDFKQAGQDAPLAVFGHRFTIGAKLRAAATVSPGNLELPVRLRYQACDASTCYPPIREEYVAMIRVVAANATIAVQHQEIFAGLRFKR